MKVRGIRGATTAEDGTREAVLQATHELLRTLVEMNGIKADDVAAVHCTTSPDLISEFPAVAARTLMGWEDVPLLCGHEMAVPNGQERCIRILILWNTACSQSEVHHVYLKEAADLRTRTAKR